MKFRTELEPKPAGFSIDHSSKILAMGSCFAENAGQYLIQNKFDCACNPFGTVFHPVSLTQILNAALSSDRSLFAKFRKRPEDKHWVNFDLHSTISATTKADAEALLAGILADTHARLHNLDVLILTFGTAKIWQTQRPKRFVSNCHRFPAKKFNSYLMPPEEIAGAFDPCLQRLRTLRPNLKVILTVSPIRHLRTGLEESSVSKSILRWATHQLAAKHDCVHYFPAYEILLDDLRDYRFFDADLAHPSPVAVDYISEKFAGVFFPEKTRKLLSDWEKIQRSLAHSAFEPESEAHQNFLKKLLRQVKAMQKHFDCTSEIERVERQIIR